MIIKNHNGRHYRWIQKDKCFYLSWDSLEQLRKDNLIKGYPIVDGDITTIYLKSNIYTSPHYAPICDR